MVREILHRRVVLATLALAVAVGGCASSGGGSADGQAGRTRADMNSISQEELAEDPGVDLWTVIRRIRPRWLQQRGASMSGLPSVVVDGIVQEGGGGILSSIRAMQVESVRYMSAVDATTRYGLDMIGGAIIVERKR